MANNCWFFFFSFLWLPFLVHSSLTRYLPGFHGVLPFELETGYVGVGESEEVQLFYYFIKSERNPSEDPLVVWLTGGPGCSSLTGLVIEIGPLQFNIVEYNGTIPTLLPFPDSWTKVASIIFLDQPAGSGFSYSKTPQGRNASDLIAGWQVDQFVRKWLLGHPEFLLNPLYIAGDSYSGKTVPPVTLHISDGNEEGIKPQVNLKGYILGNPITNKKIDDDARIPYAHGMGLLSDELFQSLENHCKGEYHIVNPSNIGCSSALQEFSECIDGINILLITDDNCGSYFGPPANPNCKNYYFTLATYWANDTSVRGALGVRKGSIGSWVRCNYSIPYVEDVENTVPYHANLSSKGYRSLIYSGDHDMLVSHVGTQSWIRMLNYPIVDKWRPWKDKGQVLGYTKTYANQMTFATIKGGGHTAEFKRPPYFTMFKRWIDGRPL